MNPFNNHISQPSVGPGDRAAHRIRCTARRVPRRGTALFVYSLVELVEIGRAVVGLELLLTLVEELGDFLEMEMDRYRDYIDGLYFYLSIYRYGYRDGCS